MDIAANSTQMLTPDLLILIGATKNIDSNEDTFPSYSLSGQTIVTNVHGYYILLKDYPFNPLHTLGDLTQAYLRLTGKNLQIQTNN